jgi:hypothetical protein
MHLIFLLLLTFSFPALAGAKPCKVFGISDSPQRLICQFEDQQTVKLSCINGNYFLNKSKVLVAYHLDVEEGASPLVFKAKEMKLTVTFNRPVEAELELGKVEILGTCK